MTKKIKLKSKGSIPQVEFHALKSKYAAFVAGYGSGKTQALINAALDLKMAEPTCNTSVYMPSYPLIKTIAYPRYQEILNAIGLKYVLNKSDHWLEILGYNKIFFRSLTNPESIIGYETADSIIDEWDVLPMGQQLDCWIRILARNRQKKKSGKQNRILIGTTPEGFKHTYEKFGKNPQPEYQLVQASTYSNQRNLPDDYIETLKAEYDENVLDAYLYGKFTNLNTGTVYRVFNRETHSTLRIDDGKSALHIGMDFNVGKMAAVVHVLNHQQKKNMIFGPDGQHIPAIEAIDEIYKVLDTPAMIEKIKEKFPNRVICVYPDASGGARKTENASSSDIDLLKKAGFRVMVNSKNPAIKDRINAMNGAFCNATGLINYKVNPIKCKNYVACLEQQAYDNNGVPEKRHDYDHLNDAAGYCLSFLLPIVSGAVFRQSRG